MLFAVHLYYAVLGSYTGVADDRLANTWIDTYLNADVEAPASEWAAEFTDAHYQQPPNQVLSVEHPWARDFLSRHEHNIW